MIILASDTSTSRGSVALRSPEGKILVEELEQSRPHSETLLPAVERVLEHAGVGKKDVEALAVGTGPGAFTGLRVGLATFKAWAAAAGLPLIPVVSLDAVALPRLLEGSSAAVLADARKSEVYAAYYPGLDESGLPRMEGDVMLVPHEGVKDWIASLDDAMVCLTGTGLPFLAEKGLLGDLEHDRYENGAPDAATILHLSETLLSLGHTVEVSGLVPTYVRPPDAKTPSSGTIVRTSRNTPS